LKRIAICMPAFNEEEGIGIFLQELYSAFEDQQVSFVVVDDCSTDHTVRKLQELSRENFPVNIFSNLQNRGHGYSTVKALREALNTNPDLVIAVDGDGQFFPEDIRIAADSLVSGVEVVEGVRSNRKDPLFRRFVSRVTRTLIFLRSGTLPLDANTPLRIYNPETLEMLIGLVPKETPVPNLFISSITRKRKISYREILVRSRDRLGSETTGSTWGRSPNWLPSRSFVRFVFSAVRSWLRS
jgi:dolichol-phosphate mannosyltransferase